MDQDLLAKALVAVKKGQRYAFATVVQATKKGTPRKSGAKMLVLDDGTLFGTIGGGQLEYQSTRIAAGMLGEDLLALRSFPLGSSMGQCCGGVVEILFDLEDRFGIRFPERETITDQFADFATPRQIAKQVEALVEAAR